MEEIKRVDSRKRRGERPGGLLRNAEEWALTSPIPFCGSVWKQRVLSSTILEVRQSKELQARFLEVNAGKEVSGDWVEVKEGREEKDETSARGWWATFTRLRWGFGAACG